MQSRQYPEPNDMPPSIVREIVDDPGRHVE
jgi:hypothetical protein